MTVMMAQARQRIEQSFDMARGSWIAAGTLALRRRPAGVQAICRGNGEHADIAADFADHAGRCNCFVGDSALIGNDDCTVGPRLPQPIGAVERPLTKIVVDPLQWLFERLGGQPQID